jgi:hypothetical protein
MQKIFMLLIFFSIISLPIKSQIKLPPSGVKINLPTYPFTIFPVDLATVKNITPLGNLNPGGHTFPTDHCYINLKSPMVPTPIYAPGVLTLTGIYRSQRFVLNTTNLIGEDFSLFFSIDATSYLRFDHVSQLSDDIKALLTTAIENDCTIYDNGSTTTYKQCRLSVNYNVSSGAVIGKVGGQPNVAGLDIGAYTVNVKPPYGVKCPFSFYKKEIFDQFKNLFGNSIITRTTQPICGTVLQDVDNTLQGRWIAAGKTYYPEDFNIAFVADNFDPSIPAISVGNSQVGLPANVYTYNNPIIFKAINITDVNQPFQTVKYNGKTYCYNLQINDAVKTDVKGSMLVKMTSNTAADIEFRPNCNCACNKPYTFTNNKVSYVKAGPTSHFQD